MQPRTLPPTSAAAKYHSLRVNHQVQQWRGVHKCATEWGWRFKDDKMSPVATDLQPAPEYLLEAINYNCKTDCSSTRCSCVRFGLYCSPACGQRKGLLCCNVQLYNFLREIVILPLQVRLRIPYTFKGRFFGKTKFKAKFNNTSLASFSKKTCFKILKRA